MNPHTRFERFLIKACLLGGALLIWLSLLGGLVTGIVIWQLGRSVSHRNIIYSPNESPSITTDSNGQRCMSNLLVVGSDGNLICTR